MKLFSKALNEGKVPDFLIGVTPFKKEGRDDFGDPQDIAACIDQELVPLWTTTHDNRIAPAILSAFKSLLLSHHDTALVLYNLFGWALYYYGEKKDRAEGKKKTGEIPEIDFGQLAPLVRQILQENQAALQKDIRWAGAPRYFPHGLWSAFINYGGRIHDQFEGPDFRPNYL